MSALDRVRQLEPIQFRYRADIEPEQRLRAGFSAQQVQALFPDSIENVNGYLYINLEKLRGHVNEALQELGERNA